jgi:cell wall-associated NlpC family hydrolase
VALTRTPSRVLSLLAGAALIGASVLILPHIAGADPGQPSVGEVTAKLDKLARQNEVLTEKFNKATIDVKADQKAADAAQKAALSAAAGFDKARARLSQTVIAQYESSSFSHAGALLTSQNGQSYLDTISTLNLISTHRAEVLAQITAAHAKAKAAQKTATRLLAQAKSKRDDLDKQKRTVEKDTAKFKALLDKLTAPQQQAFADRNSVPAQTVHPVKAASNGAQLAVNYAIAQVGKSYVFAAAGPDAFDCSGLTMMAWEQAGVYLPHLASAQYNYGQHVSYDQLRPGDLIFLYSPISHVEIYIGNDIAVSAADEQLGIRYVHVSQDMGDWAGATHIG